MMDDTVDSELASDMGDVEEGLRVWVSRSSFLRCGLEGSCDDRGCGDGEEGGLIVSRVSARVLWAA